VPLALFLPANNHQTSYEDVFTYRVSACKTWSECFPTTVYAYFETAIHIAGCEVRARLFHLGQRRWRKIQPLGLSKQYGKKDSEVSQLLKKMFRMALFTGGSLRLLCVGLYRQSSERQASGTALRLTGR
jgi:hypothetical protein